MKPTALLAMVAWIPFVLWLFSRMDHRRAVITAFVGGWLFLPVVSYPLPGLPDCTKVTATSGAVFLAVLIFDSARLLSFRPRWFDVPMIAWCLCPFASSVTNGLGVYDGLSEVVGQTLTWGLPYLIGRLYFYDLEGLRELVLGIVIGGVAYVLPCLFEMRMSPQLHTWIYGRAKTQSFVVAVRFGGYRPAVFMQTGLMLGLWMAAATLSAYWFWATGAIARLGRYRFGTVLAVLGVVTLLCKSSGALLLLIIGLTLYQVVRRTHWALPLLALVLVPPLFVGARASKMWDATQVVDLASATLGPERAQSLQFRIENENLLRDHALEKRWFGWGGWGRSLVSVDEDPMDAIDRGYQKLTITDSLWIIAMGKHGLFGLTALGLTFLLPPLLLIKRLPARYWVDPVAAPAAILATLITLYCVDNLLNNMLNPVYIMAMGGLSATVDQIRA